MEEQPSGVGQGCFAQILILVLVVFFFLGVSVFGVVSMAAEPVPFPVEAGGGKVRSMHHIDSVEVVVMESYPMQLQLHVIGSQPDGCDFPVQVTQRQEGDHIYVEIFRELPADVACPMVVISYEETIRLEGGFESGTYTLHVNDYTTEISL